MKSFLRQAVYFLMLTLASNAVGWTFNNEAVADVWFDELRSVEVDVEHTSSDPEYVKAVSHESKCNHWCHAVGQLMGLLGKSIIVTPEFADNYFIQHSLPNQLLAPDSHFRPPRFTS